MKKNTDLLKLARRKLQGQESQAADKVRLQVPSQPKHTDPGEPAPEQSKGATLLARAKAAIAAGPPPEPRMERVKLLMTCSQRGLSYLVIAERRSGELRF